MDFVELDDVKVKEFNRKIHNDPVAFAKLVLGIDLHEGQIRWLRNSTKRINILRPGNRWGKSLVASVKHIWQCMCKPNLDGRVASLEEWNRLEYNTLNFGPTYELGKGALQLARDLVQGNILLPNGTTNNSILKDWAIIEDRSEATVMPFIQFRTGSKLLGRSMSEMGVAFKMRKLAYISGDECADVPDLWTFVNNTLLMRVVDMNGQIDLVGTPQPEGTDYMNMIEMAQEDMERKDWKENGKFYTQKGITYENTFLPVAAIKEIESIADPEMREQIIRGEYVETGNKYYGFSRVQNAVDKSLPLLEEGISGRKYLTGVDFAGGESVWADYTVIMTVDFTEEPYKVVQFQRFKGGDIPIPAQYKLVEEITDKFGGKGRLVIDSSSLGGKNAMAFLGHLHPISAEFGPTRNSTLKADMLATLKITLDGGQSEEFKRTRVKDEFNNWRDLNEQWGLLRLPNIPVLISELQNYKLEDQKIRNDCVMCLIMIVYWIEMRRPKKIKEPVKEIDFYQYV